LRILTDHNIQDSLSRELERLGHDVSRVGDLLRGDTPDQIIDYFSAQEAFIVITHDGDFKGLPAAMPRGYQKRMGRAGRIVVDVDGPRAGQRILDVHDLILFTWEWSQRDKRVFQMIVTLTTIWIKDRYNAAPAAGKPASVIVSNPSSRQKKQR